MGVSTQPEEITFTRTCAGSIAGPLTLANEVLGADDGAQRALVYQAAPGPVEHDTLVLPAMTTEDIGTA